MGICLGGVLETPICWLAYLFTCLLAFGTCNVSLGWASTDYPSPKDSIFRPKLAFLGHFWATNDHFLGKKFEFLV